MAKRSLVKYAELACLLAGAIAISVAGVQLFRSSVFQTYQHSLRPATQPTRVTPELVPSPALPLLPANRGGLSLLFANLFTNNLEVAGRIDVPRLGMSVFVVEGDDDRALSIAPGHVPESAALGEPGNAVIAGHREMTFRALQDIRLGDEIKVQTDRWYEYRVFSIRIVKPDTSSVMDRGQGSVLTLITCYPFYYLGNAPKRFVVQARLVPQQI